MHDLFSERYGYITKKIQYGHLNQTSKNRLWDVIDVYFANKAKGMYLEQDYELEKDKDCSYNALLFYYSIHINYWGETADSFSSSLNVERENSKLRSHCLNSSWYIIFDTIEALYRLSSDLLPVSKNKKAHIKQFEREINKALEEERCSYRMAAGLIIPNVNDAEIITIVNALSDTTSIKNVNIHLEQAIKLYSDRTNPDYRNAAKEAISSLEALLILITKLKKGTMSDALKSIKQKNTLNIHPSLHNSLVSLYAWAGDESGVRHSIKGETTMDITDTKLIIVTCCSFVSYLIAKATTSGIDLKISK